VGMGIHGYGYYDTRTRPVNMRVSKILVPAGSGFPFSTRCGFYPRIPASTGFFDIPRWDQRMEFL